MRYNFYTTQSKITLESFKDICIDVEDQSEIAFRTNDVEMNEYKNQNDFILNIFNGNIEKNSSIGYYCGIIKGVEYYLDIDTLDEKNYNVVKNEIRKLDSVFTKLKQEKNETVKKVAINCISGCENCVLFTLCTEKIYPYIL